jgi:hypothetical protein
MTRGPSERPCDATLRQLARITALAASAVLVAGCGSLSRGTACSNLAGDEAVITKYVKREQERPLEASELQALATAQQEAREAAAACQRDRRAGAVRQQSPA